MDENNGVIKHEGWITPTGNDYQQAIERLKEQKNAMDDMIKNVMKDGVHFGVTEGCGDKPSLYKPGAELLLQMFRYNSDVKTVTTELDIMTPSGVRHREYKSTAVIYDKHGDKVASLSGSCSTLESKYRYRKGAGEPVRPVPGEYWDIPREKKELRQEWIKKNAPGLMAKKQDDGSWFFCKVVDKVETPDIADLFNTCLKMSEKRGLTAATLVATASSDKFTQDIEDTANETAPVATQTNKPAEKKEAPKKEEPKAAPDKKEEAKKEEPKQEPGKYPTTLTAKITKMYANTLYKKEEKWDIYVEDNSTGIKKIGVTKANAGEGVGEGAIVTFTGIEATESKGKTYFNAASAVIEI